jgi:Zn-dependent M28 family amino/carboxypeptidase
LQVQDSVFTSNPEKITINIDSEFKKVHGSQNVIGYLPCKKKHAKTIVFSAHYDHLGRMGKDTYFPGANDNASGCSMLFYLADYFKNHPSKYNLVFIAFAGEEAGLIGSNYYVQNPLFPLKDIRFLVNLDIMGSGEEGITAVNATLFPKEFELLTRINKKKKYLKAIKSRGPAANSDHYFFTEAGVPAFFIYTMGSNKNYHDVFDKYESLTFSAFENIGNLIIDFVRKLN